MKVAAFRALSVDKISADMLLLTAASADMLLTAASPFRDSLVFVTHGVCLLVHERDTEYH